MKSKTLRTQFGRRNWNGEKKMYGNEENERFEVIEETDELYIIRDNLLEEKFPVTKTIAEKSSGSIHDAVKKWKDNK